MIHLGERIGLIFYCINGQFSGQFVETSSTRFVNSWTTLCGHVNTLITTKYRINIPPIPSFATTHHIVPLINYSS
jgi:hypothetical protein